MEFSRYQLVARHILAAEPLVLPPPHSPDEALNLERAGNWYLAAETYNQIDRNIGATLDVGTRARLLVHVATCFELARQPRASALAYHDAARLLSQHSSELQTAGELYNRAAHQHLAANEFSPAGMSWRAAASEFRKLGTSVIILKDNILPIPISAAGLTISANCFDAAGNAFVRAHSEEIWAYTSAGDAVSAYWEAGNAMAETFPIPNIQCFNEYRKALNASASFYNTLESEKLRSVLPLTPEQRAAKLDPFAVLENAAFRCHHHHQPPTPEPKRTHTAQLATDRDLVGAFHEFSLRLSNVGNPGEAGIYRAKEKERLCRVLANEKRFVKWLLYSFWKLTSGYGESLARWAIACTLAIIGFGLLYGLFQAIEPSATNWFDYLYFSIVTFTSLGYGDFHPHGIIGKALACAEISLGLIMFGVLLSFLGARFQQR